MKIFSPCQKCSEELNASTKYDTRGEHAMRKGEYIDIRCRSCNTDNTIHIDDFKARESKKMKMFALISLLVTLVIAVLVFLWLINNKAVVIIWYGMLGVPFLIYGSLIAYDKNRVSTFNRLFAKR